LSSYPALEPLERRPEAFAHVLVALPYLGNEGSIGAMLAQDGADLVEVDLAVADLQAFAVEPLGIAEVKLRRVRAEQRQTLAESEAEMIGSALGVRDVDAHAQVMPGTEGRRLVRKNEDVLMPLTAEVPREGRHGLRRQLDAVHVELFQAGGEDFIAFG